MFDVTDCWFRYFRSIVSEDERLTSETGASRKDRLSKSSGSSDKLTTQKI